MSNLILAKAERRSLLSPVVRYSIYIVLGAFAALIAASAVSAYVEKTSFAGVWVQSIDSRIPEEMRINTTKSILHVTLVPEYPSPIPGFETIDLNLDGAEHLITDFSGAFPFKYQPGEMTSLSGRMHGTTIELSSRSHFADWQEQTEFEQWSLRNNGQQLVITRGRSEIAYRREPWMRSLFTNYPTR